MTAPVRISPRPTECRVPTRFAAASLSVLLFGLLALSCATTATEPGPGAEAQDAYREGLALLRDDRREESLVAFRRAVELDPFFVAAHRHIQNLRLERLEGEALVVEYGAWMEARSDRGEPAYLYGRMLSRVADQLVFFERATRLSPHLPWGHYGQAFALQRLGREVEAEVAVTRALRADPEHVLALVLEARLLQAKQQFAAARERLDRAAAIDPGESEVWYRTAQLAEAEGRTRARFTAIRRGLTTRPPSAELVAALGGLVVGASDDAESWLAVDLLEELAAANPEDAALAAILARAYEVRGRPEEALAAAARALALGYAGREPRLVQRRLHAASDPARSVAVWQDDLSVLADSKPRLETLARVARSWDESPRGRGPSGTRRLAVGVDVVQAMLESGWIDEALIFGRTLEADAHTAAPEARETVARLERTLDRARRHRRLLSELRLLVDEMKAHPTIAAATSLRGFLEEVARLVREITGFEVADVGPLLSFPFVGDLLDVAEVRPGTLGDYFGGYGQVLFAGRLAGDQTQVLLLEAVSGPRRVHLAGWPEAPGVTEVVGESAALRSESEQLGEAGGRALYRSYYLDLDILVPWKRGLLAVAAVSAETKERLLASHGLPARGGEERRSLQHVLHEDVALLLRTLELHGDLPVFDHVRSHEQGHLFDALDHLPLWERLGPNLQLAIEGGFNAYGVMALLEEKAQLHALRYGPAPHFALADIVRSLPSGPTTTPHARGYARLLERFLIELDHRLGEFPALRPDRRLLHQLHHLTEDQIRSIAEAIWGS